jgi:hypothetical protein
LPEQQNSLLGKRKSFRVPSSSKAQPAAMLVSETIHSHVLFLLERHVHLLAHAILAMMIMDHPCRECRIAYLGLCKDEVDFFERFPCSLIIIRGSSQHQHPIFLV